MNNSYDVIVIGAGPGGMAAAISAYDYGAKRVLIIDRNAHEGGILKQCIHDGFGLLKYKQSYTGPEYAAIYSKLLRSRNVEVLLNAMVTGITAEKTITCVTRDGVMRYNAKAIILATGCRERTRGMIVIPGTRPSGIYTAGVAQYMMNIQNLKPGNRVVILGSGDIGLIMARRFTLEGLDVVCVLEKLPECSGLPRNKYQCLDDWNIPLYTSRTVIEIRGQRRLEGVIAADVDANGKTITGTEYLIECDTLVLSVGLIPENELAKDCGIKLNANNAPFVNERLETSIDGIFACGNSLQVLDLVDKVSEQGELAGKYAAEYLESVKQ